MPVKADYLGAAWDAAVQARFWSKVDRRGEQDCWNWTSTVTPKGYGTFSINNRHYAAHRLLLVKQCNDELRGQVCDHLCRNRRCVNPAHLEVVTNRENIRRGDAGTLNKLRGQQVTHCPRGHAYTPENTRLHPRGSRCCRECDRITSRAYRARSANPTEGE